VPAARPSYRGRAAGKHSEEKAAVSFDALVGWFMTPRALVITAKAALPLTVQRACKSLRCPFPGEVARPG